MFALLLLEIVVCQVTVSQRPAKPDSMIVSGSLNFGVYVGEKEMLESSHTDNSEVENPEKQIHFQSPANEQNTVQSSNPTTVPSSSSTTLQTTTVDPTEGFTKRLIPDMGYLQVAARFEVSTAESLEICYRDAQVYNYDSFFFNSTTNQCYLSSYWRQPHMMPDVVNQDLPFDYPQIEVYFNQLRMTNDSCYLPNLKWSQEGSTTLVNASILEENIVRADKDYRCLGMLYRCTNGQLSAEHLQIDIEYSYDEEIDMCLYIHPEEDAMNSNESALFCRRNMGTLFTVFDGDRELIFLRDMIDPLARWYGIGLHYEESSDKFVWEHSGRILTKLVADEYAWGVGEPQDSATKSCVGVGTSKMKTVNCEEDEVYPICAFFS